MGPDHFGTDRLRVKNSWSSFPQPTRDRSLLFQHNPFTSGYTTLRIIDASKVIWAREMDAENNLELIRYYH